MDEVRAKVVDLDLNDILPNRFQPRIKFSEDAIIELSESIKEHGVIQPIVVRPIGDKYEIIAGERRYKASVLAGKDTIPAIVTNLNDKDSAEVALIENVQRRDLSAIEEAISYKKILDMGYLTQEQLAIKLGKSQSTVANKVRLLNLCDEVQEALMEDKISERHARSLLKLSTAEKQKIMLDKIIKNRLTVRKTDEEIDKMNTYITDSIEEPKTDLNSNAFSSTNPGFVDVDKIENQAQEINQPKKEVDFGALLKSEPAVQHQISDNLSIPVVDPFLGATSNVTDNKSEIPTTPIVEDIPPFEMPTTVSPIKMFDNIVNPEPENNTIFQIEQNPIPTIPSFDIPSVSVENNEIGLAEPSIKPEENKSLSLADLLAPQGQSTTENYNNIPVVDPFLNQNQVEANSVATIPSLEPESNTIFQTEQNPIPTISSFNMNSTVNPIPQIIPTTPIVEESLPNSFITEPAEEPAGEEKVITPPEIDSATGDLLNNSAPEEVRPIIITDYSKQYDPVLPEHQQKAEKIDFKQIINLIRDVTSTIEKCGYELDTEEYDLEDTYQVIFKINKN